MTGPEHAREAERLLAEHDYASSVDDLLAAQVHATLALVAAVEASPGQMLKLTRTTGGRL